jgi:hypothetical protein
MINTRPPPCVHSAPGKQVGDMVEMGGLSERAGHTGAHRVQRGIHPPRRAHPRALNSLKN